MEIAVQGHYAEQLEEAGVLIIETAELLLRLLRKTGAARSSLASKIREIKQHNHDQTRRFIYRLHGASIKPLDIKLIGDLSKSLSGILLSLAQASYKIDLYQIQEPFPFTESISEVLFHQSQETQAALKAVLNGGPALDHCAEIMRLGDELNRLHETSTFHLFESVRDPLEIVKRKEIIDALADAAKKAGQFAHLAEFAAASNGRHAPVHNTRVSSAH